jgi:putative Holliday junction resolvase
MRVLGLDIGDVRIGVALSDPCEILASPLTIITRKEEKADIDLIVDIIEKNQVGLVIAGLPISLNGSIGQQAEKVKSLVAKLEQCTEVPIRFRDERLSTVSAKQMVREVRKTGKNTRYDAMAAAIILQGYLDENAPDSGDINLV